MAEKVANKEALQKIKGELDCAICLQPYTDPKLLPCFHVFCTKCLEKIVVRSQDGHAITCPKCRRITPLPPNGVTALAPAIYVNNLFEIRDTLQKAKQPQKTQCEKCKKATATGFCRDCGKFVCDKCTEIHQLWEELAEHQVVGLSDIQEEASTLVLLKRKVLFCSKHEKQELKIYCETCNELICTDCTIRLHLGHHYDLVADTFSKHREEIQAHLQPVRQQLETIEKALPVFGLRAKEIGDHRTATERDIHRKIDQLHKALDQRRAELVVQLDQITQQKLMSLDAQRDQLEMIQAQLASCLDYVEGSLTTNTPAEVLTMKEPVIQQIKAIATDLGPDTLAPQEEANAQLIADNLEQHCRTFGSVQAGVPEARVPDPIRCHVLGDISKSATVGEETSVTLQTVDKDGKECSVPVKDVSAELVHCTDQITTQCEMKSDEKGKYTVTYTPATRGRHQLHIKVGQAPIGCSPLPVTVKLPPHRLGKLVRTIENLVDPRGVALDSRGQILVSEGGGRNHVSVFSPDGQKVQSFGNIQIPWGACLDSKDNILVAGHHDHKVHQFSPNGEHLQSVGNIGSNPLQFYNPIDIAYSSKSRKIYVTDYSNHRIQVLNEDLSFSATFGTQGSGNGQLQYPYGVAFDSRGNVCVADYGNNRIQVFTQEGQFIRTFGTEGDGPGQLQSPRDIHIDGSDTAYVVEFGNHRVSVFTTHGQFLTTFGQEYFRDPIGLAVDENGYVIVSDYGKKQLLIF